jgi:uncharacterized protein (DUF2345 family)
MQSFGGAASQAQTPQASPQRLPALQATEADRERQGGTTPVKKRLI